MNERLYPQEDLLFFAIAGFIFGCAVVGMFSFQKQLEKEVKNMSENQIIETTTDNDVKIPAEKPKWEIVTEDWCGATERLKIPGGWLYKVPWYNEVNYGNTTMQNPVAVGTSVVFVPGPVFIPRP